MCVALFVIVQLMRDVALSRSRGVGLFHPVILKHVTLLIGMEAKFDPTDIYFPLYRSCSMEEYDEQVNLEHVHLYTWKHILTKYTQWFKSL